MHPNSMEGFLYTVQPYDNCWQLTQRFNTSVDAFFTANPGVNLNNLYPGQMIRIPHLSVETTPSTRANNCVSKAEVDLKSRMRLLWEEHIAWTRMTIISLTFHLPDVNFVIARLLQNATDMGNSLRPIYGDNAATKYASLIKDHLLIAADLVKAALAGNQELVATTNKKWYANADAIAEFLSGINLFLSKEEVRKMFYEHLDLTKLEAVCMIEMNFKADVEVYDKIETEALGMSDAITDGVVKQFPEMFKCAP